MRTHAKAPDCSADRSNAVIQSELEQATNKQLPMWSACRGTYRQTTVLLLQLMLQKLSVPHPAQVAWQASCPNWSQRQVITDFDAHLLPQKDCFPPETIYNCQLLFDFPVFLMLKLLQPSIIHQVRVLAFLALVPLNLKQYFLQHLRI